MDMTTAAARGVSDVDRSVMAPPDSVRHRAPAEGGGAAGLVGEEADAADARQSETHSPGGILGRCRCCCRGDGRRRRGSRAARSGRAGRAAIIAGQWARGLLGLRVHSAAAGAWCA